MEVEVIHGQIIAKANHYQAVPSRNGEKRIIKDEKIRAMNAASCRNARSTGIGVSLHASGSLSGCGIVRYVSTWITA